MSATELQDRCTVCRTAEAKVVDSEQGPVCLGCSEDLAALDDGLSRISLPIFQTKRKES